MVKKGLLTKKVAFQGTQVTMYSLDGVTWSTRPDELEAIVQRHLMQQAGVSADLKGEDKVPTPKIKPKKFNRVHDDSELDEVIEDDIDDTKLEEVDDIDEDSDDIDVKPISVKKGQPLKSIKPIDKVAKAKPVSKPKAIVKTSAKPKTEATKKPNKKPTAKLVKTAVKPKPKKKK